MLCGQTVVTKLLFWVSDYVLQADIRKLFYVTDYVLLCRVIIWLTCGLPGRRSRPVGVLQELCQPQQASCVDRYGNNST